MILPFFHKGGYKMTNGKRAVVAGVFSDSSSVDLSRSLLILVSG